LVRQTVRVRVSGREKRITRSSSCQLPEVERIHGRGRRYPGTGTVTHAQDRA